MQTHDLTSISEFLGDFIVYRNLSPMDARLPDLDAMREAAAIPPSVTPRKSEPAYARVIAQMLQAAREIDAPGATLRRVLYVGDTEVNDGGAFHHLRAATGWPGMAFIGAETDAPAQVTVRDDLYLANRWAALADFDAYCRAHALPIDAHTAIIIDLDKTAIGARGRNDHVINAARVAAVRHTVDDLLGDAFDAARFEAAYDTLNQPRFHPFTTDNQDYLAYICLIIGSDFIELETLIDDIRAERWPDFAAFIAHVDARRAALPADLRAIHAEIYARVQAGDPTPFKAFRRQEYRETVARMGRFPADAPVATLLTDEIVLTQEVRSMALAWRERGALLFGLSDKPDEASIPTEALAAQGYRPIHQTATHAVGADATG